MKRLLVTIDYDETADTLVPQALSELLGLIRDETKELFKEIGFVIITARHEVRGSSLFTYCPKVPLLEAIIQAPESRDGRPGREINDMLFHPLQKGVSIDNFRRRYRNSDFVVVDDLRTAGLNKFRKLETFLGKNPNPWPTRVFSFVRSTSNSLALSQSQRCLPKQIAEALRHNVGDPI